MVLSNSWNSISEIMGTDKVTGENIHIYQPFSFASVLDGYTANCRVTSEMSIQSDQEKGGKAHT